MINEADQTFEDTLVAFIRPRFELSKQRALVSPAAKEAVNLMLIKDVDFLLGQRFPGLLDQAVERYKKKRQLSLLDCVIRKARR